MEENNGKKLVSPCGRLHIIIYVIAVRPDLPIKWPGHPFSSWRFLNSQVTNSPFDLSVAAAAAADVVLSKQTFPCPSRSVVIVDQFKSVQLNFQVFTVFVGLVGVILFYSARRAMYTKRPRVQEYLNINRWTACAIICYGQTQLQFITCVLQLRRL